MEAVEQQQQERQRRDVYSRLADPKSYTGVYRKRFEMDCHDISEHNVHSLSNMMRTNLNYDVDPRTKRAQYVHVKSRRGGGGSPAHGRVSPAAARPASASPSRASRRRRGPSTKSQPRCACLSACHASSMCRPRI